MARAPAPFAAYTVTTDDGGHIDVAMPVGTRVPAIRGGKVVVNSYSAGGGFFVIVEEPDGFRVTYAHGNLPGLFVVGARIAAGDTVLYSGGAGPLAGHSTGPHLHLWGTDYSAGPSGVRRRPADPFRRFWRARWFPFAVVGVGALIGGGVTYAIRSRP